MRNNHPGPHTAWILVAGDPHVDNLLVVARSVASRTTALVAGSRATAEIVAAGDVDDVVWLRVPKEDVPPEAYASAVADAIRDARPDVVLAAARPADRVLLGAAASALQASAWASVKTITSREGNIHIERRALGGAANVSNVVYGPAAFVLDGGRLPRSVAPPSEIRTTETSHVYAIEVVESRDVPVEDIDLGSASRLVAVGRGVQSKEDLGLVRQLAAALDAELACSRPLAEERSWLPRERYVGYSGQRVAPALYFAIGISGEAYHMVGVEDAGVIMAINVDRNAPVFQEVDYGAVGDLYELVPALCRALGRPV